MLKEIHDHIPLFSLGKKNAVLDQYGNNSKNTTYAHNNKKVGHSFRPLFAFFFKVPKGVMEEEKF